MRRVVITGGAGFIGSHLCDRLLQRGLTVVCLDNLLTGSVENIAHLLSNSRFSFRFYDVTEYLYVEGELDAVVHFAAVTHSRDEQVYWDVNYHGTMRLARSARERGCRRFVFVSTRCATEGSGAYGESKLAAEKGLLEMDWDNLLILRPAEIYGGSRGEGIDGFLRMADRLGVVPLLWGHKELRFAPIRADDFIAAACALIGEQRHGVHMLDVCGPENLSGAELALRIARSRHAVPIPMWWPALALALHAIRFFGLQPVTRDQIARLTGRKTKSHSTADPVLKRPMARFLSNT